MLEEGRGLTLSAVHEWLAAIRSKAVGDQHAFQAAMVLLTFTFVGSVERISRSYRRSLRSKLDQRAVKPDEEDVV